MSLETIVSKMIAANEPESNIAKVIKYHKKDNSKINCEKCDHSWKVSEGGNDLYMCHECGHNNNKSPLKAVGTCPDGSEPDEFGKCNEEKELSTSENEKILRAERDNKVGVMDAEGNLISEDRGEIGLEKSDPDQAENIALEEVVVRAGGDSRYRDEDQVESEVNIAQKQQEGRGKVSSLVDEALGDFNDGIKVDKFALGDPLGLGIFVNPVVNLLTGIDEEALQKSQNLDNSFNDIYEKSLDSNPYIKSFTQRALKYAEQDIKNANAEIKENIRNFYISKDEEYREKFDLQIDGLIDSIITEAGVGRYINGNITLNESTTVDDFNVLLNNGLQKEIDDLTNNFINEKIQQDEDYTKAYEEYVKKANQNTSDIIKPLVKKDKVLQDIKKNTLDYLTSRVDKIQEKRIDDQYSGDFSTEDILGRGAKNISKAFYEWSQGTMPAEINEQFLIGNAKKLRNINKDLYELENDPRKNSLGQILTRGGNNNKAFDTIEEAIEFKKQELEDTTKKAAERYAKSKEYQKEVGRFEQFEFFGDKPVTWAGYTKTFGTQAMQAVGNVLSLGTSTLIQESGAAYRDIVERLAAKDLNMTLDEFNKIKPTRRDKAIFDVIKSGRGTNEAISIGTASAGLEFAGNMLMIGGTKVATKGIVDSYVKKEIKDQLISKAKSAGKAFDDIALASSGEALTEVLQAGTSRGGVAATTGESLVEALASPEAIKEYMESGFQALTTAGPLVGTGRGLRNLFQYVKRNPEGLTMRKQAIGRNYEEKKAEIEKMPTSTTYEKFQKNKALEKLNSDTDLAVEEVTIANEFVQNTIFKNADATTQAEMIENEVELRKKTKEQQSDLEKQKNTTDYQKNNSFVFEAREEEIKKRNEEIKKLEGERNLLIVKEYGKKNNDQFLIDIVNESTDGKFADKSIKRVETRDEAINELKTRIKNGTLKEEDVYVLENGKRKGYQPEIKLLVETNEDGTPQNNAAVIGGNFGLIVDENVNENIRKVGDFAAANSVNHEILHFITDDLTSTELKDLKNGIISEVEKSDDQNLKNILSQTLEREKSYKEQTDDQGNKIIKGKGSKKILGNEFLAAFSDAMAFYDIKDISLKKSSVLDKIATKFNGLFKKQLPKDLDFSGLNASNVVEFITRYNNFNNTKEGTIVVPKTKTKTKTKKPNLPSKPLTKEELATEFSTLEKGKIPDQTAVQAAYAYEPLAKSIANRMYRDYPDFKESGFTKDDFAMELTFGQGANSLLGLAKSYDPKVGSIGGYFDRFLPERAKAVMEKFIGKSATNAGTSLDTTEARELEADEKIDVEATDAVEALAVSKPITDITTDKKTMELATLAAANALKKLPKKATVKQQTTAKIKAFDGFVGRTLDLELKEILKKTKNKNEFDKFLNNEWEFIGNAFLDNTDIGKIRNEQTRELLEGWEDNGFTKKDVFDYFNDPNLAKNTRSDRKNVGLIKVLRAELGDIMRINIAKNDPATAADFKKSTGIPLASRPLGEIARQNAYLKANPNAPQTLPYNTIEKLIAANSGFKKVPVLDTPEKAIEFVKSLKDLVFSLPVEIVTKTGFYNPSGRIFPNYDKNKKWINSKGNTTGRFKNNAARAKAAGYFLNKSEGRKKFEAIETAFNTERDALIKDLKANSTVKLYGVAKGFTAYKFADLMGSTPAEILNNKDKILDQNVKAMAMHEQVWKPLYEFIKKDPKNNAAPVGFLLKNGSKTATHWHRAGIEMVGTSKKFEGGFTYEHAMPMVSAYLALIDSAAKNVPFDISYPAVQSNYKLLALSKKDDNKLKGPYKAGMGDGWNFYTGNWKERYFNPTVAVFDGGINPASIIDLNGENYAKKYNINNKGFSTTTKALASKPLSRTFYEDGDGVSQIESPLSREFNKMLEKTKGVKADAVYSDARAAKMGTKKGFQAFVPYSAEDFLGLIYPTLGKGEQGNKDLKWWKDNVMTPYNDGMTNFESAKQAAMIEWNQIKDQIQNTPTNLGKEAVRDFSNEDAIRVYLWDQKGVVPDGLSKKDISALTKHIKANPELEAFANQVAGLNINGYPDPTKGWLAGTITTDLVNHVNTSTRSEMLEPWQQAIDEIYTKDNKNKLRATYGDKYIEALDDILYRMKTGRNRPTGANRITNNWLNWVNDSVGTIMFFNQRSAILQTISSINFINWSDNNPIAAAKAFANQKQYWSDFAELFNSDFLKQRRSGLKTDVNSDEIAQQAAGSTNKVRAGLSLLLKKGFLPTQIADSFAIASGGSTFYRNRINSLMKEGMNEADAKKQAFSDFRDSANESQQSSDPSRISMEQASSLGRVILAFANTPIQYTRLTKRAVQDLMAGRGDWKTNVSKIVYYGAVQNIIFTALQQAMFGMLFADDDDEFQNERKGNATFNIANSTADTFLRGSGVAGAFVAMLKNMALEVKRQSEKSRSDYTKVADKLFTVSPPIDSKFRKLKSAGRAFTYKQELEKMRTRGVALDNPGLMAIAQTISAFGNIPADRVLRKLNNIVESTNDENAIWQRIALAMGWGQWELGIEDRKTREAKIERDAFKRIEKSIGKVVKKREKDAKKKSPIKDLAPGVLGEANRDGSIVVAKGLSKKKREEVIKHEKVHQKEMKSGKLDYDDNFVYYGKKKYERKNGKIMHNGKAKIEGDHSLPWEKVAHNA